MRYTELEGEYHAASGVAALRATRLSDEEVGLAEAAFKRLERPADIVAAVDHWLRTGRVALAGESPRLDEALAVYLGWLATTSEYRADTKRSLRARVSSFVAGVGNLRVADVQPADVESYLARRKVSPDTKEADCRGISSFFTWCMKGKRRWTANNPCYAVEIEGASGEDDREPVVLAVEDCEKLLRAAEGYAGGRLVPYVALCLFGGLRPAEVARLAYSQVNLVDREIRLMGRQTKTGKGRVVGIGETLAAWLEGRRWDGAVPCSGDDCRAVRAAAGWSGSGDRRWVQDVLRHTAISHYFRESGSYGRTAEQFGNSESIIKKHYQSRVSSEETRKFYALRPKAAKRVSNVVPMAAAA